MTEIPYIYRETSQYILSQAQRITEFANSKNTKTNAHPTLDLQEIRIKAIKLNS